MARAARPTKGGAGYFVLVFFIVLSVALIGGYMWMVPQWAKRGSALVQIQRDVKENLEDPLKKGDPTIAAKAVPSAYDVAYGNDFFSKVKAHALDGLKYADLVAKSGYDSPDAVGNALKEVTPEQESLRAYITKLKQDAAELDRAYRTATTDLGLSNAARDRAQRLLDEESARLKKAREDAAKQLEDARKEYDQVLAGYKQKMTQADEDAKKAWAENRADADRHKKDMADKDAQITKLKDDLRVDEEELQRKKPKEVAVTEGHVLQADPIAGFAIIDLGKRENIQNGEKFTVVRLGKGGVRIPKGELQIVRVDTLVSRAEVIQADPNDPVMRDDIVQREKKTE